MTTLFRIWTLGMGEKYQLPEKYEQEDKIKIKIFVKLCGYLAHAEGAQVDSQITMARAEVIGVGVYGGNLSNSMIPWYRGQGEGGSGPAGMGLRLTGVVGVRWKWDEIRGVVAKYEMWGGR
jgi:hypothetical protein